MKTIGIPSNDLHAGALQVLESVHTHSHITLLTQQSTSATAVLASFPRVPIRIKYSISNVTSCAHAAMSWMLTYKADVATTAATLTGNIPTNGLTDNMTMMMTNRRMPCLLRTKRPPLAQQAARASPCCITQSSWRCW